MQAALPHPLFDRLTLGLVVALIAVPLTFLEATRPSVHTLRLDIETLSGRASHTAIPSKPAVHPSATPAAKPTPAPAAIKTATTTSYVHLRTTKSVSSAIITDLPAGTAVQLGSDADAIWQGVTYQGKSGYIYRAYLQYQPAVATP